MTSNITMHCAVCSVQCTSSGKPVSEAATHYTDPAEKWKNQLATFLWSSSDLDLVTTVITVAGCNTGFSWRLMVCMLVHKQAAAAHRS